MDFDVKLKMTDNKIAKSEELKKVEISISTAVLVWGSGLIAGVAARELAKMGHEVFLCSPEPGITGNAHFWGRADDMNVDLESLSAEVEEDARIQIMAPAEIIEFYGSPGRFQARLKVNGDLSLEKEIGAVILANEPVMRTGFEAWGVSESERVRTLSWVESELFEKSFLSGEDPLKIVFLCGFTHHSNPFSQQRAVEAALRAALKRTNRVFFLTEHFKVAHKGMERLTRKAREAGVLFVKLSGNMPGLECDEEGVEVSYFDETLGEEVLIKPDLVVLEESYMPPPETRPLSKILEVNLDRNGFFQEENIYNRPIFSNRVGVWIVGPAKGPISCQEGVEEARAAALGAHQLLSEGRKYVPENRIALDSKKCTICLTCYRLCPHRAISYQNRRPIFSELSCKVCGICAAECPMDAIQIHDFSDKRLKAQIIDDISGAPPPVGGAPLLVAFCCQNSALEAANLASHRGLALPGGLKLISVPCAGKIDPDYLLTAFRAGADGVMVLGCHHEGCKSFKGSDLAEWRVEFIKGSLAESGLDEERLFFGSLAPCAGSEFAKIAMEMENFIRDLGESPVRRALSRKSL